jgi:cell division protein FtsI/penicillin-binding protein 2
MSDDAPQPDRGIGLTAPRRSGPGVWPGSKPVLASRRRRRPPFAAIGLILAVIAVIAVVALVAAGAYLLLGRSSPDRNRERAEAFLAAWSRGDTAAMQAMVSPSAHVAADLKAVGAGLHLARARYQLDRVARRDGKLIATFTVRDQVTGVGPWTYSSSFELVPAKSGPSIVWSRAVIHPRLGPHDVLQRTLAWAPRAPILGAGGQVLAGNSDVVTIGVEPRRMTDEAALTQSLQVNLHVDPATVAAALHAPGVRPDEFVPIVTVPRAAYEAVKPVIYPVPGLEFRSKKGYTVLTSGFASVLLGDVGPITAEQLHQLGGTYEAADTVGRSGLEEAYERSLAGTPTADVRIVDTSIADRKHDITAVLLRLAGHAPVPLHTTIDPAVQQAAQSALAAVTQPAALVALDGQGNVRALVSAPAGSQFDRALYGVYPPGSTFKVVTTYALLAAGVTPSSTLTCPSTVTVDGRTFQNFESESLGPLSFTTAFAKSCNTAFIGATAQHLSAASLRAAARTFGFDRPLHLGVTAVGGSFPTSGDAVETAADAIGQGKVTASPLQMASVAAAVMSGQWHPPTLLPQHTTRGPLPPPLTAQSRADLTTLMHGVVTSGTGTAAAVAGLDVAGKTGTAEFGHADPPHTHAWFIGFADGLAVAIVVEDGGVGGQTAAPILHDFFTDLHPS